jgi:hypothetical protein
MLVYQKGGTAAKPNFWSPHFDKPSVFARSGGAERSMRLDRVFPVLRYKNRFRDSDCGLFVRHKIPRIFISLSRSKRCEHK